MYPTHPTHPIPATVLLVSADHVHWLGLHALLAGQPEMRLLDDVRQAAVAARIAAADHPDYIVADADGNGIVPLARQCGRASPASRVVVVGAREALRHDQLERLIELGLRGYLLWEGLRREAVVRCLAAVRDDGLFVADRAVTDELAAGPERRQRPRRHDEPVLDDEQRIVLAFLTAGLREKEIAPKAHMSERKVRRVVATLCGLFGVSTTCALCAQAGRLGFVSAPGQDDGEADGPFG